MMGEGNSLSKISLLLSLSVVLLLAACRSNGGRAIEREPSQNAENGQQEEVSNPRKPEPIIQLLFTGDIILGRCVYEHQAAQDDFTSAFSRLAPFLRRADLTIGSLDSPLSDVGQPIGCVRTFNLLAPSRSAGGLVYSDFDVVTVAGNHAKDCGSGGRACDEALTDTISNLNGVGIATVGAGDSLAHARAPAIVSVQGVDFAFLGYEDVAPYYHAFDGVPGTAPLEEPFLAEDVADAKARADVVVVLPHWGQEYTSLPTERQIHLARRAVEAGATLVVGNHPHWVQAGERLGPGFVAYALGNFVFDQDWSLETQQGAMLQATFQGSRLVATRFLPVRIDEDYRPAMAEGEEAAQILSRIEEASRQLPPP